MESNIFYVWDKENPLCEVEHSDDGIKFDWLVDPPYYKDNLEEAVGKFLMEEGHVEPDEMGVPQVKTLCEFSWAGRTYQLEYQIPLPDDQWEGLIESAEKEAGESVSE